MGPGKLLLRMRSGVGTGARLSTLIFHRVLDVPDPMFPSEPDIRAFDWLIALVSRHFNILPLDEAVNCLYAGTLPPRALAITFDDGYRDNVSNALPVLRRHGVKATFFIASGYLGGSVMWNDLIIHAVRETAAQCLDLEALQLGTLATGSYPEKRTALASIIAQLKYLPATERSTVASRVCQLAGVAEPGPLMMGEDGVRALGEAGMGIGGHTVTHPILTQTGDDDVRREIADGRQRLETITGRKVRLFAYPNGRPGTDYERRHTEIVRECGFDAAFTTSAGVADASTPCYQLPRFTPWDRSDWRFLLRMARNYSTPVALA